MTEENKMGQRRAAQTHTVISVRIAIDLKAALDEFAARERRTQADAIRIILEDRLQLEKRESSRSRKARVA
jgi:hypothetical protein